ncbi:DUF4400 domain-containing protein [Sphaerotilus sp.]|uniref:DUF4400 domain-containing protein n=1 Tax=Sphaerotilus sp. TaxID=2093942 RepID=UPI002ACD3BD5|nr:DUF4400 domain-containing protein [Sphaerotilus sp.]MDZ7855927.1 DUF4400 domain-containing protein [Sphaerotilus sp.]
MIRLTAIASLTLLLVLVLYLPAAMPPERFVAQLRSEQLMNERFWGQPHALRILNRMLDLQAGMAGVNPVPSGANAPSPDQVHAAVADEMGRVNQRLFQNVYFRSIDALLALATYRFCALLEWLPALWLIVAALFADGLLTRVIRSMEFKQHNPEVFALHACAAIAVVCGTVLAFVLPIPIDPMVWGSVPLVVAIFVRGSTASYHRRP